ncbi:MAG TPA: class A beta-lactamase, subclass A2 [Coleofasciculaceae cyanobacterium]|jgi:beta-lactamase class A
MIQVMIKRVWLYIVCLSFLTVGCKGSGSNQTEGKQDSQTNLPLEVITSNAGNENELRDSPKERLRQRIEQITRTAQGRVGVTAMVLETGQSVTLNGEQRFPMQSVYKLPIAMAVLAQVDRGKLKLDQRVRVERSDVVQFSVALDQNSQGKEFSLAELLKYMVSDSDNTACDMLLRLIGGPKIVTQYVQSLGVNDIVVANTEKELAQDKAVQYRNYATSDTTVVLLRSFHKGQGLSESSQTLLLQLMMETSTGLKRIKGMLPTGTPVAHKTGTSSTVDGVTAATNDVGLVTLPNGHHFAIAIFVSDAKADIATREAAIAKISRAVWDEWSK